MIRSHRLFCAACLISFASWVFGTPIASAQSAFVPLPNGRHEFRFGGHRFALTDHGDNYSPHINLCIPGMPDTWPREKEWEDRTDWSLERIVKDPDIFRENLSQARSISVSQFILSESTMKLEMYYHRAVKNADNILKGAVAKMSVDIDATTIDDHPCYDHGERARRTSNSQVDAARLSFEEYGHENDRFERIGPLSVYRGIHNTNNAYAKLEARDRSFPAIGPLYVWCSWPDCRRLSRSNDYRVITEFVFESVPNAIDPERWPSLDKFFHEYTFDLFQGVFPRGIE